MKAIRQMYRLQFRLACQLLQGHGRQLFDSSGFCETDRPSAAKFLPRRVVVFSALCVWMFVAVVTLAADDPAGQSQRKPARAESSATARKSAEGTSTPTEVGRAPAKPLGGATRESVPQVISREQGISRTETDPAAQQQRKERAARAGFYIILLLAATAGLAVLGVVALGRRTRRLARRELPAVSPPDPLWYLKKKPNPAEEQPTHQSDENTDNSGVSP